MREEERAPSQDSRPGRVIRGVLVVACLVPLLHSATCARHGHEASRYMPPAELNDPLADLGQMMGILELLVGIGLTTLFSMVLLLVVLHRGLVLRWLVSILYGPLLLVIGIRGLHHADLHRFLWGSMSLIAGAILTAFAVSQVRLPGCGPPSERRSLIAIFSGCTLASLFASVNLPAQTTNRILHDSPLSWTYHAAEKRDPYERLPGWECARHGGRCDCLRTDKPSDRGTCGEQRCCYRWNNIPWMAGGPDYPVEYGCFCVNLDSSHAGGPCPEPASFAALRYNSANSRSETCP